MFEMLSSVDALIALAEDLLRLARAHGGAPSPGARARIADIVREALRMASHIDERHVMITISPALGEVPVEVRGAVADLARALRNLIDNAVAHSPPHGQVRIEVTVVEGGVELAVVDQGPGVPLEDQPHIFTAFYRGA